MLGALRSYLDRRLFPDASPAPRLTAKRALLYASVALLACAVQLLRVRHLHPLDRLQAEDGFVWLADAQGDNPLSALSTPYNGYLQTSSRLVAEAVAELPVAWWASAMAISGILIVTGCAFVVWRASAPHIHDRYLRAALSATVVLLGVLNGEMLANVVNTIWFIAFACFWLLLWRPRSELAAAAVGGMLLLGTISHSATLFLAPLWLLRLVAVRDRRDVLIVAGFTIGAAVQLGFSYDQIGLAANNAGAPAGQPFSSDPYWDWNLIPAYAQRVVGGALAGQGVSESLWEGLGWPFAIMLAAALVGLVVWALRTPITRVTVPLTLALSLTLFLASGYLRWGAGGGSLFWPLDMSTQVGARYVVVPALLALAALFIQLDATTRTAPHGSSPRRRAVRAGVVCIIVGAALFSFDIDPLFEDSRSWSAAVEDARASCRQSGAESVDVVTTVTVYGQHVLPLGCERLR